MNYLIGDFFMPLDSSVGSTARAALRGAGSGVGIVSLNRSDFIRHTEREDFARAYEAIVDQSRRSIVHLRRLPQRLGRGRKTDTGCIEFNNV
jgi:hypothetical protein